MGRSSLSGLQEGRKNGRWWGAIFLALIASVVGCHRTPKPKALVVTSIFPVYDLTRRIAGPDADVIVLEPLEVSPHQYAPAPNDVQRATGASLAVMIGLDLDAWMQPMMTRVAPKARVLRLADRVPTLPRQPSLTGEAQQAKRDAVRAREGDEAAPPGAEEFDVHVWLDPQRALLMARAIVEELCRVDGRHASAYRERGLAVTQSLEALDHEIEARTATWKQRSFVTLHDAFRYYAARYHLEIAAAIEARPGVRPQVRYDQMVLARMRERHAGGVFGEPQLDSQAAIVLSHAAELPYGVLDPLGGAPGVDSYEALIRGDTDVLEKALLAAPAPTSASTISPPP